MSNDDRSSGNHNEAHTNPDRVEGGSTTKGTTRDTTADTVLEGSRTGGMGGMPGTIDADTDMAGTAPAGDVEDR